MLKKKINKNNTATDNRRVVSFTPDGAMSMAKTISIILNNKDKKEKNHE